MDITTISVLLKIITWTGGVFISVWVIKLLREINSKQKEYILLIEKAFQEREKTRDQKIELLDISHKKEIELIEREKLIFFKTMESEKKNLELQISKTPETDSTLLSNLIVDLKADLSLAITKISSLNVKAEDLTKMKEIVGIAGDINRKTNIISFEEAKTFNKLDKINLQEFILDVYNKIFTNASFQLLFDEAVSKLKPITFDKRALYIMITEIFSNARHHSTSESLKIYGSENANETKIVFENSSQPQKIDFTDATYLNKKDGFDLRPNGLYIIKDIMRRYKNEVTISSEDKKFEIALKFHRSDFA